MTGAMKRFGAVTLAVFALHGPAVTSERPVIVPEVRVLLPGEAIPQEHTNSGCGGRAPLNVECSTPGTPYHWSGWTYGVAAFNGFHGKVTVTVASSTASRTWTCEWTVAPTFVHSGPQCYSGGGYGDFMTYAPITITGTATGRYVEPPVGDWLVYTRQTHW